MEETHTGVSIVMYVGSIAIAVLLTAIITVLIMRRKNR